MDLGAKDLSSSDDNGGHAKGADEEADRHTPVEEGRMRVGSEAVRPRVQQLDSRGAVEGIVITGGGFRGGSSSGSGSGGSGVRSESPPRDSAKGKGPVVVEGASGEVPVGPMEFRPVAKSSGHRSITKGDFAEYVDEEMLACLLEENPTVVVAVLAAREERQRQIEKAQEEERLRAEAEGTSDDEQDLVKEAERAQADAAWAQESAVALAKARAEMTRAEFVAETYTPPEPHVFIPSGFDSYQLRWDEYDPELVLRDPTEHLSVTWAEVYLSILVLASILNCCIRINLY